ncbi:DUF4880 domain-containing protein [Sphingomonas sp. AP4-R1]|uniref:FecR family protein n=1 Tax=Sphingomonas sp. AP4-R1 TaxID=2735134 RepID=UPI0014935BFA|nr:FecR domain-containing protein [Sphingomonas sp. AP4-R1]QJU60282.1 DUF4880 domain-containing protein [Sphingomonas sp. AP4-R1]
MRAEAAAWFARLKTVPVSRGTLEEFFAWRRKDGHYEAFEAVERFWSASALAADRPAVLAATEAALHRRSRKNRWFGARSILAACSALALGGIALSWSLSGRGQTFETRVGQQSIVTLDDGSRMTLDTGTRVAVRFDAQERHVRVDRGQAYFTVAHAADRPFTVAMGDAEVKATGTQFAVRMDGGPRVTLIEGRVLVSGQMIAHPIPLSPGQQVQLGAARPPVVTSVNTAAATAWTKGRIVLDGATLAAAVTEVNRYTVHPVRLEATRNAANRLSGSVETGDVAGFVEAATAILPVKAVDQPDGTIRLTDMESKSPE